MRLRCGSLTVLALFLAGCATVPPPPPEKPSLVAPAVIGYRSAADAPAILEAIDRALAEREGTAADLSTPDLSTYSGLLMAAGRFSEAEQAYQILLGRVPSDRDSLLSLAFLAAARGDVPTLEARTAALEKAFPGDVDAAGLRARLATIRGDRQAAAAAWQAVLAQREDPAALVALAGQALADKDPDRALSLADRAVTAGPADDGAWAVRAQVETVMGRYLAALDDLDKAVELAPDDPWHRLDRGKLSWLHLFAPESALADLEFSVAKDPGNFLAWSALAEVAEDRNQPRKAYDAWQKALSLRPDYRFAYPSMALLSFRYLDFRQAAAYAQQAALDHPSEFAFPFIEAFSLQALGQARAALTVLEKARPRYDRGSTVDQMFRFLLTPGSDYYLNTAMKLETKENLRIRLRFYQGVSYTLLKAANSARAAFQEVEASTLAKIPEIGMAKDWLEHGP